MNRKDIWIVCTLVAALARVAFGWGTDRMLRSGSWAYPSLAKAPSSATYFAAFSQGSTAYIYKSTNSGRDWSQFTTLSVSSDISLAVSNSYVFAAYINSSGRIAVSRWDHSGSSSRVAYPNSSGGTGPDLLCHIATDAHIYSSPYFYVVWTRKMATEDNDLFFCKLNDNCDTLFSRKIAGGTPDGSAYFQPRIGWSSALVVSAINTDANDLHYWRSTDGNRNGGASWSGRGTIVSGEAMRMDMSANADAITVVWRRTSSGMRYRYSLDAGANWYSTGGSTFDSYSPWDPVTFQRQTSTAGDFAFTKSGEKVYYTSATGTPVAVSDANGPGASPRTAVGSLCVLWCTSSGVYFDAQWIDPKPGSFSLSSPANGATDQPITGNLSWGASSNAASYNVYWGTSNPPAFLRNVTGTSTPYSGENGKTYRWYVVAKNGSESTECNSRFSFSTVAPAPAAFNLLTPANNSTGQPTSGTVTWQASTNVTKYSVYLSTDPQPSWRADVTGTSYSYSGLSVSTKYYWGILAIGPGGSTRSTPFAFNFTTVGVPGSFNLSSPADGAVQQSLSGTLSWGASAAADSYYVYFGTSNPPSFLRSVASSSTSTSYSASNGRIYYWYVKAKNSAGEKECNKRFIFTTQPAGIEEPCPSDPELADAGLRDVKPSIFRRNTYISYSLSGAGPASLRVLSAAGTPIRVLKEGTSPPGLQGAVWDGTDDRGARVTKGVYFFSLEAEGQTWIRKLVKTE